MIVMGAGHSTSPGAGPFHGDPRPPRRLGRRYALLGGAALLGGCTTLATPPGQPVRVPGLDDDAFVMPDGGRLPYRAWLPVGPPSAVMLALHGFNDSRNAWEIPAPDFAAAGIALYSPDQRGFGAAPGRGLWAGADGLAEDAGAMARLLQRRHPGVPLYLMGESMGGAVLMHMATRPDPPEVAGYVLVAPAVWGRARMNVLLRSSLWLAATLAPGLVITGPPPIVRVRASDNLDALIRLSRDPLTMHGTRFDTLRGLVDLMDAALAAAPRFAAPALLLYGAKDELVPKQATRATWEAVPQGDARMAYYPNGYHLLMRDLERALPIRDTIAWIADPTTRLPSAADRAALAWLETPGQRAG